MESSYLEQLNKQQRDAVEYIGGPELVIAGAGSGKTRVITYKIVHLLAKGYEPWRIMALTFTNKAAREMKERVIALTGSQSAQKMTMGTFHSVFARMLRANSQRIGYRQDYTIYDADDARNLVKLIIRDMELDEKVYKPSAVYGEISRQKNNLVLPEMYMADPENMRRDRAKKIPLFGTIYQGYCARCRVAQAMDFDDLLVNTNLLLRDNPDIRRHYQEFYRYILVDEYQDTNFAQHAIVRQLAGDGGENLCVVGDDAQSIYSFRGANISNILNLKKTFAELRTFKLEQNYRSTENIINAAGSLIAKNKFQIPKKVFSDNGEGMRVEVVRSYSDYEESYLVASRIQQLRATNGSGYGSFAILYRTNAQSRILEESLRKRGIPYRIYGGLSFYQRKEVKDTVAYFRLAVNPDDDEALRRVINVPARGIGETTMKKVMGTALANSVSLWTVLKDPKGCGVQVNNGTLAKLEGFRNLVLDFVRNNAEGVNAGELARYIVNKTGLARVFETDVTPENISRRENVMEVLNNAMEYYTSEEEQGQADQATMANFLAQISLATDEEGHGDDNGSPAESVTLMTIHAAKGLEFDNVFVVGVEEELLPSSMSNNLPAVVEEERRLLYVAITRAKKFCQLSYAGSRFRNGATAICQPSRFLGDIDSKYLNMVSGVSKDSFHNPFEDSYAASRRNNYRNTWASPSAIKPQPQRPQRPLFTKPSATGSHTMTAGNAELHNASELSPGMTIEHNRFGIGVISTIDTSNPQGDTITVRFSADDSIKKLLLKFARFAIVTQ